MPAEPIRLDLPEDALEELTTLAQAADRIPHIMELAAEASPHVGTRALSRTIAPSVGMASEDLWPVMIAILNLYHTQVGLKTDAKGLVAAVTANLKRQARTPEGKGRLARWEAAQPAITAALASLHPDHPLELAYKAYTVASASQYDLIRTKIYSEIRPVFNDSADAIVQCVVSHVLTLVYHDGHSHHAIQFTLDANELAKIREQAERAERKAAVIKKEFGGMSWPTSIFREPMDSITGDD